jgi:lysophospholipase L1-like esterase
MFVNFINKRILFLVISGILFAGLSVHAVPPSQTCNLGDVNGDNDVNIVDALLVAQFYVGMNPQNFNQAQADVNSDGQVTIVDGLLIAQIYVGVTTLTCSSQTPTPLPSITIFIAGDSTVQTYDSSYAPQEGWGQELYTVFNSKVTINNQALAGRSSRTFMYNVVKDSSGNVTVDSAGKPVLEKDSAGNLVDATRWARIKANIKAGDYLLVQFGTNDSSSGNVERFCTTDDFKAFLGVMIDTIKGKSATPVLVTPTAQRGANNSRLLPYANAMKELGTARSVQVVDLNARSYEFQSTASAATLDTIYLSGDSTHFQQAGAIKMAQLIAGELKRIGSPLVGYLK